MLFDQAEFDLRCEWGLQGLQNLSPTSDAVVIVDVLCFAPASMQSIPAGTRLVLPSPNGSTLCLNAKNAPIFTACLRNAAAVAAHLARFATSITLIPAGERWSDDTLRPCLEDWIGAGAVLSHLTGSRSPESELAIAAFTHFCGDLKGALSRSGSGKELLELGFPCDVELASEYATSRAVPVLVGNRFGDAEQYRS